MESAIEPSPEYKAARRRVRQLRGFYSHLAVYVAVNAGLLIINLFSSPGRLWIVWPLAGWGIAVVIHGASVFLAGRMLGREWEERKIREIMRRK
jgi:hypothetical protein